MVNQYAGYTLLNLSVGSSSSTGELDPNQGKQLI